MGGLGGKTARSQTDARLAARAMRDRWPMTAATRLKVLRSLIAALAKKSDASPRERIIAARALISADSVNLNAQDLEFRKSVAGKGDAFKLTDQVAKADRRAKALESDRARTAAARSSHPKPK